MPAPKDPEKLKLWKQRLSESHEGHRHSLKTRIKISFSSTGKKFSEDSRKKMQDSWKIRPRKSIIEMFFSKVEKTDFCWNWKGSKYHDGYPRFRWQNGLRAHRFSYEFFKGKIPEGLQIDHICRNRKCVNPDHLEAVTHEENNSRSESITAINARKTHCIRNHEFTTENTYVDRKGSRHCKICGKERLTRWKLKQKTDSK